VPYLIYGWENLSGTGNNHDSPYPGVLQKEIPQPLWLLSKVVVTTIIDPVLQIFRSKLHRAIRSEPLISER